MEKSKVYWLGPRGNLSDVVKGQLVFEAAGLQECFRRGDRVAIKVHCGEWNNTGYLRPSIVVGIVEAVKEHGGDPFVTDTTTLQYSATAGRTTAQDEYKTAARNGFTEATLGCPFIVADGDYGLDDVEVEVDGNLLRFSYVARSIAEADAMIALTHFKGHPLGVFGGAIKNLGIGCCSKRGKIATHLMTHPRFGVRSGYVFAPEKCKGEDCPVYKTCSENCPVGAFRVTKEPPYAKFDRSKCVGCAGCWFRIGCGVFTYPEDWYSVGPAVYADSAKAVIKVLGEKHVGFVNYAIDISPWCDCAPFSDSWMLPNLGVFASKDIVAIDKACLDASDRVQAVPGTKPYDEGLIGEPWKAGHEHFTYASPSRRPEISQWIQINAAVGLGMGSTDYELVEAAPESLHRYNMPRMREHPAGYWLRRKFRVQSPEPDPECYQKEPRIAIERWERKP